VIYIDNLISSTCTFGGAFQIIKVIFMVWTGDITAAFEKHLFTYQGLDICINSAGIGNPIPFHKDETDGTRSWRHTINVNLIGTISCTQLAVCLMFKLVFLYNLLM
jgi:NAD(P)-dependent dehydrogenase (short-subunit alcohol dehydrogenase family)